MTRTAGPYDVAIIGAEEYAWSFDPPVLNKFRDAAAEDFTATAV